MHIHVFRSLREEDYVDKTVMATGVPGKEREEDRRAGGWITSRTTCRRESCQVRKHARPSLMETYHNNNNGRNDSFLRGWLPHRGKEQMACNYCFPTRTMF